MMSIRMFDEMVEKNNHFREALQKYDLYNERDLGFIRELIAGKIYGDNYICRPKNKAFLYEVKLYFYFRVGYFILFV